jgi:serine/threonine-protein kinase SRPK3
LTADAITGEPHIDELRMLQKAYSADIRSRGHSRIVQLLDHFEHSGPHGIHLCLVLELLGPNLEDVKNFYMMQKQMIPSKVAKRLVKQILLGLDYLHRSCKIVHTGETGFLGKLTVRLAA